MDYTLHQLKIFLHVTEHESITKAAEELYLTQPAVSIQLKKLQEQFPIPLTEIVGRRLYVTDFGKKIALAAERIIGELEAINYQTKTYENMLAGKLKISIASTGKYVMPYFLSGFLNKHRGIDLIMDVTNKSLVVKSLEQNQVDFALVSVVPEQLKTHQVTLLKNKLYLVGSTRLKNKKPKKTSKIFEEYPLLFRESGSATRNAMEAFIAEKKLPTYKKMELTSNEALKQALIAGLGYSIMPLIGIKDALNNNELEIIPFKGLPLVSYWNLVWLKTKKLSPVAKGYLAFLESEKDQIIKDEFGWTEE